MRVLQILVLIFGLVVVANGQKQNETATLTGCVYDQIGEVISNAKVIAIDRNGKRFETLTDENGNYTIKLPFTIHKKDFDVRTSPNC